MPVTRLIHDTEEVEGYCTCGTRLVDDARFCHRCGRPTREDFPEEEVQEPVQTIAESPRQEPETPHSAPGSAPAQVSFRNPAAVRAGFLAAGLIQLVIMGITLGRLPFLLPLVLGAGGAYTVLLYRRRSGSGVTVTEGARLGWIAGVFTFVISTVLFTFGIVTSGHGFAATIQESLKTAGIEGANLDQVMGMLKDPQFVGVLVLLMLAFNFVLVTLLCSMGGAVGARFSRRAKP